MEKKDKQRIDRREFLKRLGVGVTAVSATTVAGCSFRDAGTGSSAQGEVPTNKMTYRTDPKTGEQISLLGYGCMRWPMMPSPDGNGEVIDQETVNRLVDYALAHGVNYFDTAPPYCRGLSEKATGTALKRHPRNSYYLATKMSNHRLAGQELSPEELVDASVKMYRRAFSSATTVPCRNCGRPTIVLVATNAYTIVRKASISRHKCSESTSLWNNLNKRHYNERFYFQKRYETALS